MDRSSCKSISCLYPGNEVRLMNALLKIRTDYITDENGKVTEIHRTTIQRQRAEADLPDVK